MKKHNLYSEDEDDVVKAGLKRKKPAGSQANHENKRQRRADNYDNAIDDEQDDGDESMADDDSDFSGDNKRRKKMNNKRLYLNENDKDDRDVPYNQDYEQGKMSPLSNQSNVLKDAERKKLLQEYVKLYEDESIEELKIPEGCKDSIRRQIEERRIEFVRQQIKARSMIAKFEDLRTIWLPRSKIEQWVDEPFFEDTIKGTLVRLCYNKKKYYLAQVLKAVAVEEKKDGELMPTMYKMTNNKQTNIQLELVVKGSDEKLPLMKLDQLSNQMFSQYEFERFIQFRYNSPQEIHMDFVKRKERDILRARNYKYKPGEITEIADRRFERALRARDISEFPNVTYHLELKCIAKKER